MKSIQEAKVLYVTNVDDSDPMSLETLAEQTQLPIELLKQAHKRENWDGHWNRNREKFVHLQANEISRRIEDAGLETGRVAGDIIKKNIEVSIQGLTMVQEELLLRVTSMKDGDLISAAKFFSAIGMDALKLLKDVYQSLKDNDNTTDTHKAKFKNLTVRVAAELKDRMENGEIEANPDFEKERDAIFDALDNE
jgi:hypothetical protein